MLVKITVCNRGKDAAALHLLPTLWFRNTWSWPKGGSKPELKSVKGAKCSVIHAHHTDPLFQESLADYYLYCEDAVPLLFTENETNAARLYGAANRWKGARWRPQGAAPRGSRPGMTVAVRRALP